LQSLFDAHGHRYDIDNLDIRLLIDRLDLDTDGMVSKYEFTQRMHQYDYDLDA